MDSNSRLCVFGTVFILFSICNNIIHVHGQLFNVIHFGAIPDGKQDNKLAFEAAWEQACKTNGGTLRIPRGNYLVSGAKFCGPCNGHTNVLMNGNLVAPQIPIPNLDYWIMFCKLDNLKIFGKGNFNGNGAFSWINKKFRMVTSLKLMFVTNVLVQGITSIDSKMFHILVHKSRGVSFDNVRIIAPNESPNTDGIHVGISEDISITNSIIGTGDDCISLGHGSQNVNINRVLCGPGHGISIGSLGRDVDEKDVRGITVTDCTFTGTQNGVRIKTFAPSPPNKVSNVTFQDIVMNNVNNPIIIDQHYCPHGDCTQKGESSVSIEDVAFVNIRGNSISPKGVYIACSKIKPCKNIKVRGVDLAYQGLPAKVFYSSANVQLL